MRVKLLGLVLAVLVAAGRASPPEVEFIGAAAILGDATDRSGLTGTLNEGTPHDRLGSFGSAIDYTGRGNQYLAVNDRGPADGASEFRCRFQTLDITVRPGESDPVRVSLVGTTLLTGPDRRALVGSIRPARLRDIRYDPEGVRVTRAGTLWIGDEYGPSIDEFSFDGRWLRSLSIPLRFLAPSDPPVGPRDEYPPHSHRGRFPNRGFEGLAISADGSKLFAILQGPLIQDGAVDERGGRLGVNCRVVEFDLASSSTREWVYTLDGPAMGVSEIVAWDKDRFLVLERDGFAGVRAQKRLVYLINTAAASDVSHLDILPPAGLPSGIAAVSKEPLIDLMDSRFGLAGETMPEKFEGLAFGPDLLDGRRLLIVTVDNDMRADVPSMVYAFAIGSAVRRSDGSPPEGALGQ
jgi:hypothetical protein